MRESCIDCVLKHISQAARLLHESRHGHPEHCHKAIGHIAEAAEEIEAFSFEIAEYLRDLRHHIQNREDASFDEDALYSELESLDGMLEGQMILPGEHVNVFPTLAELRAKVLAVEDKQEGETMSGMTPKQEQAEATIAKAKDYEAHCDARIKELLQAVGLATTACPTLKMNPDDPIGMMREVVQYTDQLRDVIDRAAKHWLSLEPGVPGWHGALDGAMKAAVGEIERLRGECANADMELSKVENPFPPNTYTGLTP